MNDPDKVINVNLSSLLSLKAELLRKQAEVSKAKTTRTSADEYVANKGSRSSNVSSSSSKKRDKKERIKEIGREDEAVMYEHEDATLLEKSQRVLEAKAKYYNRMSRTGGKLNSDDNCLVLFNRKRQEETVYDEEEHTKINDSSSDEADDNEATDDPEEDWVEFTDCLGRTRKCLRKNLEEVRKRDVELAASMPERLDQSKPNWMIDTKGAATASDDDEPIGPLPSESIFSDGCSLISKHDEQRANWERKEIENLDKSDVHYQDVFFDEARQHGVGYYAFSTDEEERKRQQRELEESRQRTITEQEHRDGLRAQREKIIAERVRAAKNRQRARLGLPPLDDSEELIANTETHNETKEERKARKRAEKLQRKQKEEERERELERQQHVRPWDKEKEGVLPTSSTSGFVTPQDEEWTYKPERLPMSQEEWNEQKRGERNPEFAPAPDRQHVEMKRTTFSSMPPPPTPLRTYIYSMVPPPWPLDTFSPYQSTKREKHFQRRSYETAANDDVPTGDTNYTSGVAIPPPADLDAQNNLPPRAKKSKSSIELEQSIEAGLRFLRENCDKDTLSTKSSWTAKADY